MCTYSRARTVAIPGHVAEAQGDNVPSSSSRERTASIRRPPLEHVQKPRVSAASLSQGDCLPGLALAQMKLMTALFIYSSIRTALPALLLSPLQLHKHMCGVAAASAGPNKNGLTGGVASRQGVACSPAETSSSQHPNFNIALRTVIILEMSSFVCSSPPFAGPARPQ